MDYEMESIENPIGASSEWQIDSEWVKLPMSSSTPLSGSKKKSKGAVNMSSLSSSGRPNFYFIQTNKGERLLVVEKEALRLQKRTESGFSYWVCNIPCCQARCVLSPNEKEIVRYCRDHSHNVNVSRHDYKSFIHALKVAVREKPHVKPKDLYDIELAKMKTVINVGDDESKKNGNENSLPAFDDVRTAMYNTRNAILSSFSLKAAEDMDDDTPKTPSTNRSVSSKVVKGSAGKRKSTSSKSPDSPDLEELVSKHNFYFFNRKFLKVTTNHF